jgi:AraC family transcriptional regulator, transcriptional activator of pobA
MKQKIVPIYQLGDHCINSALTTFEASPFRDTSCTAAEFGPHHRHDYFEIIWLKDGKGVHHIDTQSYVYNGSVIFLLAPGQIHQLQQNEKAEGYIIRFLPGIFRDEKDVNDYILNTTLFDGVQPGPLINVPPSLSAFLDDLFEKILVEFNGHEPDKEQVLSAYLKILMTHIARVKRQQEVHRQQEQDLDYTLFRSYKVAIEKHFRTMHSVKDYADVLNTSTRTLNNVSRKYAGKSSGELITERIILEAKRSLYHHVQSIKEIAFSLGFEDPAYFARLFKKRVGVSPAEYRVNATGVSEVSSKTA